MVDKGENKQPEEKERSKLSLRDKENIFLLIVFIGFAIWSFYDCGSYFIWVLEAGIPLGAVLILIATYKKFPLTRLSYYLILLHSFVLLYGAHYGYAHAPLGDLMSDIFGFKHNHYDKIGHFAFGFFPVMIIREVIVRTTTMKKGKMLIFLTICVIGAAAAFYEVIEWVVSVLTNDPDFAATQGDFWDPQKDMALAFVGSILGHVVLMFIHTKEMLKRGFMTPEELGLVKEKTPEEIEKEKAEKKEFEDFRTKWKDKDKKD